MCSNYQYLQVPICLHIYWPYHWEDTCCRCCLQPNNGWGQYVFEHKLIPLNWQKERKKERFFFFIICLWLVCSCCINLKNIITRSWCLPKRLIAIMILAKEIICVNVLNTVQYMFMFHSQKSYSVYASLWKRSGHIFNFFCLLEITLSGYINLQNLDDLSRLICQPSPNVAQFYFFNTITFTIPEPASLLISYS